MAAILAWIGGLSTAAYLTAVWWLVGERLLCLKTMPLNEVGDFLAGAFGPLAILWLVLGFFQQGMELRQGTKALLLQAQELRESVMQQAHLVEAQHQILLNHEQSLEPFLSIEYEHEIQIEGDMFERFGLTNYGQYCEAIIVNVTYGAESQQVHVEPLVNAQRRSLYLNHDLGEQAHVSVSYNRISGRPGVQEFTIRLVNDQGNYWYSVSKMPSRIAL